MSVGTVIRFEFFSQNVCSSEQLMFILQDCVTEGRIVVGKCIVAIAEVMVGGRIVVGGRVVVG